MKVLGQTLRDGSVRIFDAPSPILRPNSVRVRVRFSAISTGTEGNKVVTGKKSLLGKARAKPDQVRQVLDMVGTAGLKSTFQKVRAKLDGAQTLGYSLAGEVVEIGSGVTDIQVGQLVACAGGDAHHATEVVVSRNLVAVIPDGVELDSACMATLCSIALQGVRLANPTIGETAVVIGLGAIGLLTAQILRANGCRVYGADVDRAAVARALESASLDAASRLGEDPVEESIAEFSRGLGADLVVICASTASSEPVAMAGRICRKRGRVIVVGAVGMDIPRPDYYTKELQFSVSCSYGPGRYDPLYEEWGQDYPAGFVRWTEGRNLEAALDLMAAGKLRPAELVSHRFDFRQAPEAYALIAERREPYCGVLLVYADEELHRKLVEVTHRGSDDPSAVGVGFIGCGSFAQSFLLPSFRGDRRSRLVSIATRGGLTATDIAERHGFDRAASSADEILQDESVEAVVITTRHDQHAPLVMAAMRAGKHAFVEKPLCLSWEELEAIVQSSQNMLREGPIPILHVGYNRRFSPAAVICKKHFEGRREPLTMQYVVNAGRIPKDHWSQHPGEGGGRILGEVCHFIDLMQFLCDADPTQIQTLTATHSNREVPFSDDLVLSLRFGDGSIGTIAYASGGSKRMPKEHVTVMGSGRSAMIDNYRRVTLFDSRRKRSRRCSGKGHSEEVVAFLEGVRSGVPPISFASILATSAATLAALDSVAMGEPQLVRTMQDLGAEKERD